MTTLPGPIRLSRPTVRRKNRRLTEQPRESDLPVTGSSDAIEAGREPDMPLDILAKLVREAPLPALTIAFLLGVPRGSATITPRCSFDSPELKWGRDEAFDKP